MRKFNVFSGQNIAVAASVLLMTACGGGSDGGIPEASTSSTSSTTAAITTTTAAATTSTAATTSSIASTTTTTQVDQYLFPSATLAVQHSGFCMTASDVASGSAIRQFSCTPADVSKNWEIMRSNSDYTIRNLQSNLCLRVNEAALNADPNVLSIAVQGPCDGSTNSLWNFQASPTAGQVNIVAKHSGLCLDVVASDMTEGKEIIQYTCNTVDNQPNQRWKITAVAP